MKFKHYEGKSSLGALIAIVIIIAIVLVFLGYQPYISDTMKIKKALNDALHYAQKNAAPTQANFTSSFFDYIDTPTLSIEIDLKQLKFIKAPDGWVGTYIYKREELLIPLLKINLGPIEKTIIQKTPFATN